MEWRLHQAGSHDLHGIEYRQFLYSAPDIGGLPFVSNQPVEALWKGLCQFIHCDLRTIEQVSVVSDIKSALGLSEAKFAALLTTIREVSKVIVACCFYVDPNWLVGVEKAYFDAVLDIYTIAERNAVRQGLRVA